MQDRVISSLFNKKNMLSKSKFIQSCTLMALFEELNPKVKDQRVLLKKVKKSENENIMESGYFSNFSQHPTVVKR